VNTVRKVGFGSSNLAAVMAAILASGSLAFYAPAVVAQSAAAQADGSEAETVKKEQTMETLEVTGIRSTIQSSIATKREAATIVDAISAKEIGGIPATSVGEAIETITGATTHREKGGASEIAVRGLGPFLGGATFNGREASNGSGDRSVNFNQFPSELINGITIYKSQQANLIEGAVSGLIELQTLKPLDYGKPLLQAELKGNYSPYQNRIEEGDAVGWRGTLSYVDQFEVGAGKLGLSVGVQRNDTNNPEEVYSSSSTWVACDASRPSSSSANCNNISNAAALAGTPFYTAAGSHTFRQISEEDQRDSVFAALQYQLNEDMEFNLDFQDSNRTFTEIRQDLNLSETLRGITNPIYSDSGVLLAYDGNSSIESTSTYRVQEELYGGAGLNFNWNVRDDLLLKFDYSYSRTERTQMDRSTRLRSDNLDIYGNPTPMNNQRVPYHYDARNGNVPTIEIDPRFDINNYDLFSDDARLRRDEQYRNNKINAFRFDATWTPDSTFFTAIDFGTRFSQIGYNDYDDRVEITQNDRSVDRDVNLACRIPFPQDNFLRNDSGNIISSWATFDPLCQYRGYLGTDDPGRSDDVRSLLNNDINERTRSAYVMASFETAMGDTPVLGNFGVRAVNTRMTSTGLRSDIDIINNPDGTISLLEVGDFTSVNLRNSYTRLLPSVNVVFELHPDVLLKTGVFRAMSRPDPSDLGAGRDIQLESGDSFTSVEDAIAQISATGSPGLEPLMSWNMDLSLEYYPNPDAMLAGAVYYKRFDGGYSNTVLNEVFVIDGQNVTVPVVQQENSGKKSEIYGLELSAAYRFSMLPQPFDGLGFKLGYNYAHSTFKTEDIRLGDITDPVTGVVTPGIIPPADIFGLSDNVLSAQLFWEIGRLELQAIYKYRSNYYQKFVGGPSQLRYVDDVETFDMRASFKVNKHVSLQVEALNLFDEPKVTYMPVQDSIREYNTYGPRYYAGVRVKF